MEPPDPIAALWVHAMRAELDALVTRFEAQLKQHVSHTAGARREELDALEQQVTAFAARLQQSEAATAALQAELDRARADLARAEAEVARLTVSLRDVGARARSLDEQFVAERSYVEALTRAGGTLLFDVAQLTLGQSLEATPACFGALKARKLDAALAAVVRERGRTVTRHPLTAVEQEALAAAALAAGCELITVAAGQRFTSATMEKAGTRPEPAEEDHVLECVMPGVRLAGGQGAAVHPRVLVATA